MPGAISYVIPAHAYGPAEVSCLGRVFLCVMSECCSSAPGAGEEAAGASCGEQALGSPCGCGTARGCSTWTGPALQAACFCTFPFGKSLPLA